MDNRKILVSACTVLIGIVAFFLTAFYQKVEQIARDINSITTTIAVSEIRFNNLEKRVADLETTKK